MTSGPEHYRKADDLITHISALVTSLVGETADDPNTLTSYGHTQLQALAQTGLAAAQVHATLALAAATASESSGSAYHVDSRWSEVLR